MFYIPQLKVPIVDVSNNWPPVQNHIFVQHESSSLSGVYVYISVGSYMANDKPATAVH